MDGKGIGSGGRFNGVLEGCGEEGVSCNQEIQIIWLLKLWCTQFNEV